MYIKICGVTKVEQALAIASISEVNAIGFVHVANTPRYLAIAQIKQMCEVLEHFEVDRIGLFLNSEIDQILSVVEQTGINGIQLHGDESPSFCAELRQKLSETLPNILLIKALRLRDRSNLLEISNYLPYINKLIVDAYDPLLAGGTGKTIDWSILTDFQPGCEWLLAGGIKPENVATAIAQTRPNGIDVSSGVEQKPGNKDLTKIAQLIAAISIT
jgi:phosphoribosylanthranilate isomerase